MGEPIEPPAVYREWWGELTTCLGVSASFSRVSWRELGTESFACGSGRCGAAWYTGHLIVIAPAWRHSKGTVKHEMMHDLVGTTAHPTPPFGGSCLEDMEP